MSKSVYVAGYTPQNGPHFDRLMDAADFQKSQAYAHQHIEQITRDLLMAGAANAQVSGFDATLTNGLSVSIAKGNVYAANGLDYDSPDDPSVVSMQAAHASLARIDVIFVTLEANALALSEYRPFRELLTEAQLLAGQSPLEQEFNQPTEIQTHATVAVRTGTPSANPVPSAMNANEVALYRVHVAAGQQGLALADLTDVRPRTRSLQQAFASIDTLNANLPETIDDRVASLITPDSGIVKAYDDLGNVLHLGADYSVLDNRYVLNAFLNESVDDRVAALIRTTANTGILIVYDDASNTLTFSGIPASASVPGTMSAADKVKLDAATAVNTPSTLVLRDSNGDFNGRDLKSARNVVFSDSSIKPKAHRSEDFIEIVNLNSPVQVGSGIVETLYAANSGGVAFDIFVKAEELVNTPLCFEAVLNVGGGSNALALDLYNVTDGVVLDSLSQTTAGNNSPRLGRGVPFFLTGTGRKRLVLRYSNTSGGAYVNLWRARLILNPIFSNCGQSSLNNCVL